MHKVPLADGSGQRPASLRDARRLKLYPSVTSILGSLAKPGLDKWKLQQVALASMRLERTPGESDSYFADRIIEGAFTQVDDAAELGSQIHDALEKVYAGEQVAEHLYPYIDPVIHWKEEKKLVFVEREKTVVNTTYGFAGTMDVACRYGKDGLGMGTIDFKSRKTTEGVKVIPYDGNAMQIAAYAATYWGEENLSKVFGANVFISTTEPGRLEVVSYLPAQLIEEFDAFKCACRLWQFLKKYVPEEE